MKYGELVKVSKIMDIGDIIEKNDKLSLKDQIETSISSFDKINLKCSSPTKIKKLF